MILYGIALVFNMCFTSRTPETPHERGRVCDQPRIEDGVQFPHPWKMSWHGLQEQRTVAVEVVCHCVWRCRFIA